MTSVLAVVVSNAIISAALAVVTVIVTWFWRSPQLAHGLWLLVLLKLIKPPLISVPATSDWLAESPAPVEPSTSAPVSTGNEVGYGEFLSPREFDTQTEASTATADIALVEPSAEAMAQTDDEAADTSTSAFDSPPSRLNRVVGFESAHWLTAAGVIWISGALVYLSLLVWRCICFRRVLATSVEPGIRITESATRLASKLGLRCSPRVRIVDSPIPPLVWSLGLRPLVVLPLRLLAELAPAQRDTLIAHELAHVRRRDHFVRWLEVIALLGSWWNPVAWFARQKLREAEEECCDAWVVWALPCERRSYGEAMLATIEFLTDGPKLPALAGSTFGGSSCKRRIEMIMKRNLNCRISWTALGTIMLIAFMVLPVVAQTSHADNGQNGTPNHGGDVAKPGDSAEAGANEIDAPVDAIKSATGLQSDAASAAVEPDKSGTKGRQSPGGDPADPDRGAHATSKKSLTDRISAVERLVNEVDDQRRFWSLGLPDDRGDDAVGSTDALLRRIKRLEEVLSAGESLRTGRRGAGGGSSLAAAASPRLPNLDVSPDEHEQKLQEQLLMLDVQAAQAEVALAKNVLSQSIEANKRTRHAISSLEVEKQHAALHSKEIQLQRAKTVLELFKRQAQRKRETAAGRDERYSSIPLARNRQLTEARLRAQRAEELARLKEQNQRTSDELRRLEKLMQQAPVSPETWQAVDEFLKTYGSTPTQDAKPEGAPLRNHDGGSE